MPGVAAPRSPWRTQELDDLAGLAHRFFTQDVVPHADRFAEQGHPDRVLYRRAGQLGLMGLSVPEEFGGGGGGFPHEAVLAEEQVKAGDSSLGLNVHCGIVTGYFVRYGTPEQKGRWLPGLCTGEHVGAIAMTEPGGGSDLQAIRTHAALQGDHYVVNGTKTFITNGLLADVVLLAVKTDTGQGASGISLLVCDVGEDVPGFRRGRPIKKIGQQGNDTAELFFDDVRVPVANLLGGQEGRGFHQLTALLPQERLIIAVMAVAAMERALELAVAYAKERSAFGAPIMNYQHIRFTLAECAALTRASRLFLDDCITQLAAGTLDIATAAMAKFWLTDNQCRVVDECLQIFGGYGFTTEYPIGRLYQDARVQKIYGGTNEVMRELVARAL